MIEIFKDASGGWRFRVKGLNGEIIAQSESYTRKFDAHRGALTLCSVVDQFIEDGSNFIVNEEQA